MNPNKSLLSSMLFCILACCTMNSEEKNIQIFNNTIDVGPVKNAGSTTYDHESEIYTLKGSGTNMWFGEDEFHFTWLRMSGNFILNTRIEFVGEGIDPHRKAGLIIRESLEAGSPYVSAAFHGDGLVSMQYRLKKDSITSEFRAAEYHLNILQLMVHNDSVQMQAAAPGFPFQHIGELAIDFIKSEEYYVGLFVCAHNPEVIEEARFLNTRMSIPAKDEFIPYTDYIGARLEVFDFETGLRKIVFESDRPIEAPNWSPDGRFFIVNAGGFLYRISSSGGEAKKINTDFATSNNNDHGISPDGTQLVISHHAGDRPSGQNSLIYTLPIEGGKPKKITLNSPSYWHGWSPDGQFLIFTAERNSQWNIWRIPAAGGKEIQLTDGNWLDDGSAFSGNGKYIWFNSNRSGTMEIWRMKSNGSELEQITHDIYQNWFAHESPKGDKIIFLSYLPEVGAWDHPYYKQVMIRSISLLDGDPVDEPEVIAYLYGGQGTMNVPNWSPDGSKFAFISNTTFPDDKR